MTKQKRIIIWSVLAGLVVILVVLIGFNLTSSKDTQKPIPTTSPTATRLLPSGFEPQSASFVSAKMGFVLGIANCASRPCLAIQRTQDGGKTWSSIPSPNISLTQGKYSETPVTGVSRIRFVNGMDGYLYGPDLYATHDGGATWQKLTLQGIPNPYVVTSLETNSSNTYLIAGTPNVMPSPDYLFISKATSGAFTQSKFIFPTGTPTQITVNAYGAVIAADNHGATLRPSNPNGDLFYQATGTTSWTQIKAKCPSGFPFNPLVALAAPISGLNTPQLVLGCGGGVAAGSQEKTVVKSADLTTSTTTRTQPPLSGDLEAIASPDGQTIAVGASSGATFIYVSTDGGASWQTAISDATLGGSFVHDLEFINATQGFAVIGNATTAGTRTSIFLMTHNRGLSWQEITF